MSADGLSESRTGYWSSLGSLLASTTTLLCCALPSLLVAAGAGAALSSLVSSVPQLVWVSEYRTPIFAVAGLALVAAGLLQWHSRFAPCPLDPALRDACLRTRRQARTIYVLSVLLYLVGALFAFAFSGG